jgi:hypothetical protein
VIDKTREFDVAVIGGGAAGITAAISAGRAGKTAVICERLPRLGKKILASGNGRCNLLNEDLSDLFYNPQACSLVKSIFSEFGKDRILSFFAGLGLETYSEEGRIFPVTNQSSSVLKALEIELRRLSLPVELNFEVSSISRSKNGFRVTAKSCRSIFCNALILAGGGKSYPALGSDGSCYKFAETLGHKVIRPVPSAVALVVKDPLCHILQGQKIAAYAKAVVDGKVSGEATGEALFTKYGLSGTAILDVSRDVSIAMNRLGRKSAGIILDMAPFMGETKLKAELEKRLKHGFACEELLTGILPNKFGPALAALLKTKDAALIAGSIKSRDFTVTGTKGWNEADFTAGGVDTSEIDPITLRSKKADHLYLAGEILDVDGGRGGYNLAWAWASGFVAGASA